MDFPVLVEEITADWLGSVLGGTVDSFTAAPIGTGQMALCYRLELEGQGVPERVVAKLPAADPGLREVVSGTYVSEVRFYRDLAHTVAVRAPACHHVDLAERGNFVLLLEDLGPWEQGDQIRGCPVEQVREAVVNLAGLHAPRWCDPTLLDIDGLGLNGPDDAALMAELYAPATETFIELVGSLLDPDDHATLRTIPPLLEAWALDRADRFAPVHGDYRLDNLMFPQHGPGVAAVDWQTLSLALPARDLGYLVATSLEPDARREAERDLVGAYHQALVEQGVAGYSFEDAFDDYAFGIVQGPLVSVFAHVYASRTDRGDQMFATMVRRSCAAIRDLDSLGRVSR